MAGVENRGPQVEAVCIALSTTAVVASALRCYTRVRVVKAFGLDDWTMLLATITFVVFVSNAILCVHYGLGRHQSTLSQDDYSKVRMYWWLCYIWYDMTMVASKISIGIFFLRLTVKRIHRWIIYLALLVTVVIGIVYLFVSLMQCEPVSLYWDEGQDGWCIDPKTIAALMYPYSVFALMCDSTFAILPIFLIRGLQMDRQTKIALVPVLGMGCVASLAVLVRLPYIQRLADPDFTWASIDISIWSATEQGLAVTAGNLATLRPLFRSLAQRFGMWTPSTGRVSEGDVPPTIGAFDIALGRRPSHKNQFGLATFMRECEEGGCREREDGDGGTKHDNVMNPTNTESANVGDGVWGLSSRNRDNESGDDLRSAASKETLQDHGNQSQAIPKSFLDVEGNKD